MNIFGLFTNWEYKLIAVLLASALYVYTSDRISEKKDYPFTEILPEHILLPEGGDRFVVRSIQPQNVDIRVAGSREFIEDLAEQQTLTIDLSGRQIIESGEIIVEIADRMLGTGPNIRVESILPRTLRINVVKEIRRPIIVSDNVLVSHAPEGIEVVSQLTKKVEVWVRGPEDLVANINRLECEPIDLAESQVQFEQPTLEKQSYSTYTRISPIGGVVFEDVSTVPVELVVEHKTSEKRKMVPLSYALPENLVDERDIVVRCDKEVSITYTLPDKRIDDFDPESLHAIFRVSPEAAMNTEEPAIVEITGNPPSYVKIGQVDKVYYKLELRKEEVINQPQETVSPVFDEDQFLLEEEYDPATSVPNFSE